jgi:type I restriction-modification system DNA methylase subunit
MRATAEHVLAPAPLPRYADLLALIGELEGILRVLLDAAEKRIPNAPEIQRKTDVIGVMAEANYRLSLSPGDGLKSANDHAKALAQIILALATIFEYFRDPEPCHAVPDSR